MNNRIKSGFVYLVLSVLLTSQVFARNDLVFYYSKYTLINTLSVFVDLVLIFVFIYFIIFLKRKKYNDITKYFKVLCFGGLIIFSLDLLSVLDIGERALRIVFGVYVGFIIVFFILLIRFIYSIVVQNVKLKRILSYIFFFTLTLPLLLHRYFIEEHALHGLQPNTLYYVSATVLLSLLVAIAVIGKYKVKKQTIDQKYGAIFNMIIFYCGVYIILPIFQVNSILIGSIVMLIIFITLGVVLNKMGLIKNSHSYTTTYLILLVFIVVLAVLFSGITIYQTAKNSELAELNEFSTEKVASGAAKIQGVFERQYFSIVPLLSCVNISGSDADIIEGIKKSFSDFSKSSDFMDVKYIKSGKLEFCLNDCTNEALDFIYDEPDIVNGNIRVLFSEAEELLVLHIIKEQANKLIVISVNESQIFEETFCLYDYENYGIIRNNFTKVVACGADKFRDILGFMESQTELYISNSSGRIEFNNTDESLFYSEINFSVSDRYLIYLPSIESQLLKFDELGKIFYSILGIIVSFIILTIVIYHFVTDSLRAEISEKTKKLKKFNKNLNIAIEEKTKELNSINRNLDQLVKKRTAELELKVSELNKVKLANLNVMEDLQDSVSELKRLERIKTEFLSVVTHELKTPITPIMARTEMLMDGLFGKVTKKQIDSLKIILKNAGNLNSLIADLLDISRLDSGNMKFQFGKVKLSMIISDVINSLKSRIDEHGLKLVSKLDQIPAINIDEVRVRQVISNFVTNAIKFTDKGGHITIKTISMKDSVKVEVIDTGIGISEEDKQRIFFPFEQVDSSLSRNYEGTGLGLAICRGIVLNHGGEIGVESEVGKGSIFWIKLPKKFVAKKKLELNLFERTSEDELFKFKKKLEMDGYVLVPEKIPEFLEEGALKLNGNLKYNFTYDVLAKKGFIKKK